MKLIYSIGVYGYFAAIKIASLFNPKAKLWLAGRKNWKPELKKHLSQINNPIWFHCASLGEFEQGRPLIEHIKKLNPSTKIILTFFSPSGFEVQKNYEYADYICYLPLDTPSNATYFIETVKPTAAFFIKYEFWYYHLKQLYTNNIPTYLVSAIFRDNQHFFKWYGAWFRSMLEFYSHIFTQNNHSLNLLNSINLKNASISGDTRFDRVWAVSESKKTIKKVEIFKENTTLLIAGSTWPEDEKLLAQFVISNLTGWKYVIAPHEISSHKIQSIIDSFNSSKCVRLSSASELELKACTVLIIDNIGMLSSLYQYGDIAYIGGGFGKGIHNVLEAAVFGMPIIFGPNHEKFKEATNLLELGSGFTIGTQLELNDLLKKLQTNSKLRADLGFRSANYVKENKGATELIWNSIATTMEA